MSTPTLKLVTPSTNAVSGRTFPRSYAVILDGWPARGMHYQKLDQALAGAVRKALAGGGWRTAEVISRKTGRVIWAVRRHPNGKVTISP
jgi:hypothetical protein